jgi:cytochrome c oxidase subunit 3
MSFRWAMSWFIFSEVMFFAAFFGALFYARQYSVPWLGDIDNKNLWPSFAAHWPTSGPYRPIEFTPMEAWGIPAINTLLLLSSGVTVTWAHWALKKNDRRNLVFGLALTIILGLTFLTLQAAEYFHAYSELNLKLTTGVFGSTFFLLTGFHGFHVTLGATMLIVILFRCVAGHFRPDHHFGFEAVSWYWHFVDVVWLLLFVFVYWL